MDSCTSPEVPELALSPKVALVGSNVATALVEPSKPTDASITVPAVACSDVAQSNNNATKKPVAVARRAPLRRMRGVRDDVGTMVTVEVHAFMDVLLVIPQNVRRRCGLGRHARPSVDDQ